MTLRADAFDYHLPESLIAQHPLARRDRSRLMVLRRDGGQLEHRHFADLTEILSKEDLLVVNDTRVVPARFTCRRATGGRIEGLFLRETGPGQWETMLRGASKCKTGEELRVDADASISVKLAGRLGGGHWEVRVDPPEQAETLLGRMGHVPLPPYIRGGKEDPGGADRDRYQTVYADKPGAVAAPTAGLHFTPALMQALQEKGIERTSVTLHVGPGTFAPVKADRIDAHRMHSEWYELSAGAAERIQAVRQGSERVVAVGTTSVRVLESVARRSDGPLAACSGETDIFLYPPAQFQATDALITNFHLPRSTLLMLVAAFCDPGGTAGVEMILDAYRQAVARKYRFYSYGDAMLIL